MANRILSLMRLCLSNMRAAAAAPAAKRCFDPLVWQCVSPRLCVYLLCAPVHTHIHSERHQVVDKNAEFDFFFAHPTYERVLPSNQNNYGRQYCRGESSNRVGWGSPDQIYKLRVESGGGEGAGGVGVAIHLTAPCTENIQFSASISHTHTHMYY